MKSKYKFLLKILAGTAAIALICGILFITNAFVGNPVSAMLANKAIEKYVDENYASLDLEIEKARYNFKDASYAAMAISKRSIDTRFAVYYRDGKVQRDDYETYVLGRFNTMQRLSEEYSAIARDIVAKELGYKNNATMVMYDKDESTWDILELDMKFDKALSLDAEVTIRLDLENNSLEAIANVLTDAHKAFEDNGCNFKKYGLYAENDGMLVMVNGVTPSDIESNELVNRLEKAKNNQSIDGISVFIKGENK